MLLLLFLTACGNVAPEVENTDTPEEAVAQVTEPVSATSTSETPTEEATEPAETPTEPTDMTVAGALPTVEGSEETDQDAEADNENVTNTEASSDAPVSCHVDPISNLVDLIQIPNLPEISEDNWQHGGETDAKITIIEYGDFQ